MNQIREFIRIIQRIIHAAEKNVFKGNPSSGVFLIIRDSIE